MDTSTQFHYGLYDKPLLKTFPVFQGNNYLLTFSDFDLKVNITILPLNYKLLAKCQ